jgi:hypothetical protein
VTTGVSPPKSTTTPRDGSPKPSAATSTPARIISSLQRPTVSSICSKGVCVIVATDSSVPRMISMYFAIFDLPDTAGRRSTLSPPGRTGQPRIDTANRRRPFAPRPGVRPVGPASRVRPAAHASAAMRAVADPRAGYVRLCRLQLHLITQRITKMIVLSPPEPSA